MAKHSFSKLASEYAGKKKLTGDALFFSREISGSMTQNMKSLLSGCFFRSGKAIADFLSHISTRTYGLAMISFGLVTLFLYFVGAYSDKSVATPIIAAVFSIFAIPFLIADKPLPIFFQDFLFTDYMLFEFFCLKRMNRLEKESYFPGILAVLTGILPAVLGMIFSIPTVVMVMGIALFIYISLASPEFAFFSSLLLLPYLGYFENPSLWISGIILVAAVSFIRKVMYGKRVLHIEQYDVLLGAMIFFILISGVFVKGLESFTWSIEMFVMTLGYLLASNIITNRRLAERAVNSVVIASIPPAVVAVFQFARDFFGGSRREIIDVGIHSTFISSDAFAAFLVVAIVFSFAMIRHNHGASRIFYIFANFIAVLSLVLTGELFAIFALLLGGAAYFFIKANKKVAIVVPVLLVFSYAVLLIPAQLLDGLFAVIPSLTTVSELLSLWQNCVAVFFENFFVGIGIGAECFAEEMAKHGISGFANSSNLFIELGLEAGVLALLCFVLLLVVRLRHRIKYYPYIKNSELSILSPISAACMFSLIAYGATNYIWSDMSAYYLFCAVFGIGSATLRVAKRDHDDRVFYYEDTRASDFSVVDIELT